MKKYSRWLLVVVLLAAGFLLLWFGLQRPVLLVVDGQPLRIQTSALTVRAALQSAGIVLTPQDQVSPAAGSLLGWRAAVRVQRASPVWLWSDGKLLRPMFRSADHMPGNLLAGIGIRVYPGDRLEWNGAEVNFSKPLPFAKEFNLEFQPAAPLFIQTTQGSRTAFTGQTVLAQALWQLGYHFTQADSISSPLSASLAGAQSVIYRPAQTIHIRVDGSQVQSLSSAATVGQALAQVGVSLQALDYSIPAENQPLPTDGNLRVVRVREEVLLVQKQTPFTTDYVADANTELDQTSIVTPGHYGVEVSRKRVRYEDGKEISRATEGTWVASQAQNAKIGYGTKIVIHTLSTPAGNIEYWRAVAVYATSYSPCRSAADRCYSGTSLGLPVKRGVIGVTTRWYRSFAGLQVYVPGYGPGIIADVGGGIPGTRWIDLGFTDAEFEPWHQNTILYFLTPVPKDVLWILP